MESERRHRRRAGATISRASPTHAQGASTARAEHKRDLVVIGASAGGVDALRRLLGGLSSSLRAAVCIVVHVSPDSPGMLPAILDRAGPLRAVRAEDWMRLDLGVLYVAPPARHLLVEDDHLRRSLGPQEKWHCPAIDPLFRSAARSRGRRTIGVVLTGMLGDGASGLVAIKAAQGLAVVQSPDEAEYASMPRKAIKAAPVDHVVPISEMAKLLNELTRDPVANN